MVHTKGSVNFSGIMVRNEHTSESRADSAAPKAWMAERATAAPTCALIQRTLDHSGLGVFRNCRSDTLVMSSWTSVRMLL